MRKTKSYVSEVISGSFLNLIRPMYHTVEEYLLHDGKAQTENIEECLVSRDQEWEYMVTRVKIYFKRNMYTIRIITNLSTFEDSFSIYKNDKVLSGSINNRELYVHDKLFDRLKTIAIKNYFGTEFKIHSYKDAIKFSKSSLKINGSVFKTYDMALADNWDLEVNKRNLKKIDKRKFTDYAISHTILIPELHNTVINIYYDVYINKIAEIEILDPKDLTKGDSIPFKVETDLYGKQIVELEQDILPSEFVLNVDGFTIITK